MSYQNSTPVLFLVCITCEDMVLMMDEETFNCNETVLNSDKSPTTFLPTVCSKCEDRERSMVGYKGETQSRASVISYNMIKVWVPYMAAVKIMGGKLNISPNGIAMADRTATLNKHKHGYVIRSVTISMDGSGSPNVVPYVKSSFI